MCKVGDIIVVYNATNNNRPIGRHPFVVLSDENGTIKGIYEYDFIAALMSSYDTEEKKERLRKFPANFSVTADEKEVDNQGSSKDSYIKLDQFFYFSKDKIQYRKIGSIAPDVFDLINEFIEELNEKEMKFIALTDQANKKS